MSSQMDVAPWSYKWDGYGWYPGRVWYRAPYDANKYTGCFFHWASPQKVKVWKTKVRQG